MSVSCNIYLSSDARTRDILDVMGILLGHNKSKKYFDRGGGYYCEVENIDYNFPVKMKNQPVAEFKNIYTMSVDVPEMFIIRIQKNPIDKIDDHMAFFHYDTEPGMKLISGGNNEFWNRIGKGLVEFFGGWVDYNDCDDIDKDFESDGMRENNAHEDNLGFYAFHQDMLDLLPLEV